MELPALSRDQVRRVDKTAIDHFGIPGIVLMENAGRGAAQIIAEIAPPGMIVILCGSGNNAGDGYVIARHLQLLGRETRIATLVDLDALKGDASVNAEIARRSEIEIERCHDVEDLRAVIADAHTVVDAILGTGATGDPRGLFAEAVKLANDHNATRVAIDIPTGLDCDSGVAGTPTFQANHTVTFVARKVGFEKENAGAYVGAVHVVGIGVPRKLLQQLCG